MKTSLYDVQIQSGSCDDPVDFILSEPCTGCTNSPVISLNRGFPLVLSDLVGNSVVFFDSMDPNSRLACGEINNGEQIEDA